MCFYSIEITVRKDTEIPAFGSEISSRDSDQILFDAQNVDFQYGMGMFSSRTVAGLKTQK